MLASRLCSAGGKGGRLLRNDRDQLAYYIARGYNLKRISSYLYDVVFLGEKYGKSFASFFRM